MHEAHTALSALAGVDMPRLDFWSWVKKTFSLSYQDEIEQYFENCVDNADVERVMRNLQRRGML